MAVDRLGWMKEIFEKKRQEEERERARLEAERRRRAKFQALAPAFLEKVKSEIYDAVDFYNKNVRQADWLARHDVGKDSFLIEKNTEPAVRMEVALNRSAEELSCHFEYANLPEMSFKIKVGEEGLGLELEGQTVPEDEIALWFLKDLVVYLQRP